ncbi:P-loop containing nucleoside triphosphate hydrolase protein [Auriculariales sp. MPI-PUGE-AT-0066]|nr:P-loop containing nucleoside triphosphate hydrolase protein [Auriculariales sp. MPI-PUGE-AT-0066]
MGTEVVSKKRKHDEVIDVADDAAEQKAEKKRQKKAAKLAVLENEQPMKVDAAGDKVEKKRRKKEKKLVDAVNETTPSNSPAPTATNDDVAAKAARKEEKRRKKQSDRDAVPASATPSKSSSATPAGSADIAAYLEENRIALSDASFTPVLAFDQLEISANLRKCLSTFATPTPIQACTWPPLLAGRDVVGIAETGSGKTLAFGLPALSMLSRQSDSGGAGKKGKQLAHVLVVAPTRELAIQTYDNLVAAGKELGIESICVYGGVDKDPQRKALNKKGVHVICGTPGRILDLAEEGACDLSNVSYLVLDEADRMLDKGFEKDIRRIIGLCKDISQRQTVMFSATWPEGVRQLASEFMRNPVRVTVGSEDLMANKRVEQSIEVFDDPRQKDTRLRDRLKKHFATTKGKKTPTGQDSRVLVFALYKKEAARVEVMLKQNGYSVGALHGDLGQTNRMDALADFKSGTTSVLVATDVAARGLDIAAVDLVVNYTFPLTVEDYVHRIGRTGRGGRSGQSVTFFTGENHERALAGEFAGVLREAGVDTAELSKRFPMTIKKKEHSYYGAFFKKGANDEPMKAPTKIKFS